MDAGPHPHGAARGTAGVRQIDSEAARCIDQPLIFLEILRVLAAHKVDCIVVGGVCGVLHGAPIATFDLDVVHSRAAGNIERLLAALREMDAYSREQGSRRLVPDSSHLASAGHQLLMTNYGPLDLLGTLAHDRGYEDLVAHATPMSVGDVQVRVLDLKTLIETKEATGRDKDKAVLAILRRTLEEKQTL